MFGDIDIHIENIINICKTLLLQLLNNKACLDKILIQL